MSRRDPNRKLIFQKTQIRSILSDFRKAKHKCIAIYQQLNEEMPEKIRFDSVQKQTTLKMQLLDLPGLIDLKSILLKTLSELFELQSQISTTKQRLIARKEIGGIFTQKNLVSSSIGSSNKVNLSMRQLQRPRNNLYGEAQAAGDSFSRNNTKQTDIKIPTYNLQEDTSEQKIDKISKFVASLKKNMKEQSQQNLGEIQIKSLLLHEPQYCKLREQLQRYKMRQQQMERIVHERIKEGIAEYCQNMEIIEERKDYKIVKIYKQLNEEQDRQSQRNVCSVTQINKETDDHRSLHSLMEPIPNKLSYQSKKTVSLDMEAYLKKQRQTDNLSKDQDIIAIQEQLSKDGYNVGDVVSKINSTMQNSEMRLKQLREQRKKIFMDDDIWDQFQKM